MKRVLFVLLVIGCGFSGSKIANAQAASAPATTAPTATGQAPTAPAPSAPDAGINGKWHFVMDTPGGDRDVEAEFTIAADGTVTGKYGTTAVAGTFKDGKMDLDFQMTSEESGTTAALKLVGKLDDTGALIGTWEFSEYNGTFKATRPKA
jgi:hypothetical protein